MARIMGRNVALAAAAGAAAALLYLASGSYRARWQTPADAAGAGQAAGTLDPRLFAGPVREAYATARSHPALLARLHCYCGCDKTDGHRSLLDCFRDRHGSRCEICVGEAQEAKRLFKRGTTVDQIRDALRARYDRGG